MDVDEPELPLFLLHATMFIFDKNETDVASVWTNVHAAQGFVRRRSTMNLSAVVDEDAVITELTSGATSFDSCEMDIAFSLYASSGEILLGNEDPGGFVDEDEMTSVRLLLSVFEDVDERATEVRRNGRALEQSFVESGAPLILK